MKRRKKNENIGNIKRVVVAPAKAGNIMFDGLGRRIPACGAEVNFTSYISRAVKFGDLKIISNVEDEDEDEAETETETEVKDIKNKKENKGNNTKGKK